MKRNGWAFRQEAFLVKAIQLVLRHGRSRAECRGRLDKAGCVGAQRPHETRQQAFVRRKRHRPLVVQGLKAQRQGLISDRPRGRDGLSDHAACLYCPRLPPRERRHNRAGGQYVRVDTRKRAREGPPSYCGGDCLITLHDRAPAREPRLSTGVSEG